jgi:riboflavin synthase alpha subunit
MFTGIIEAVGTVVGVEAAARRHGAGAAAHRLSIDLGPLADGLEPGASVAVSGVCLTLAARSGAAGGFDVVPESWRLTTLKQLRPGDKANLERSLRVGDRLDGHFVQGHVDGVGAVARVERGQGEWKLWVRTEATLMPCIVPKGSITLDGVSLTIVDVAGDRFSVALVPTTLERTTLGRLQAGHTLNIETDILARLVVNRLTALAGGGGAAPSSSLTLEKLRESGFAP